MSSPNTWAQATVKNDWGKPITAVSLQHRYDNDHFDEHTWTALAPGQTGEPFRVGYWTGFLRTGVDYWKVTFFVEGQQFTCKDDFYCFLTKQDANRLVICRIYRDGPELKMEVVCPGSSSCRVSLSPVRVTTKVSPRPVYIVAHRCNTPGDILAAGVQGANAAECDLQESGGKIFVNHDVAMGPSLASWLDTARNSAAILGDRFALIIFDMKFASGKGAAASHTVKQVRDAVRVAFAGPAPVNTLFSVASFYDRSAFDAIVYDLSPHEGVAIDMCDDPQAVNDYFAGRGVRNIWYGDGIFVLGPKDVSPYLSRAADIRDSGGGIKKTYLWTLANYDSIRDFFTVCAADAIFVNVPLPTGVMTVYGIVEANKAVSEYNLRKATRADDAFEVFRAGVGPVHVAEPVGVAIRTSDGHLLTMVNGGGLGGPDAGPGAVALHTDATAVGSWEIFHVEWVDAERHRLALRTPDGHYVSAVNGGGIGGPNDGTCPVHTDATAIGPWERVYVDFDLNKGTATVRMPSGHYLTAVNGGGLGQPPNAPIRTDAMHVGRWETFELLPAV